MKFKKVLSTLLFSILTFSAFSQTKELDLSKELPDWVSVVGGNAMAPAVETSYGIAVLTDGRMLSSCTSKGNVIWKKGVNGKPSKYITEHKDFLYVVTNEKKITLVNQSGINLWTANNSFKITENPVIGKDGRVFVHGEKNLACFGINGNRKWQVETEKLSNLPTCVLNDGSVLVFQESSGKTVGKRYSQYGEEMEDLMFSSEVITAISCEQGVLVALKSGSIGLCNVVNGLAGSPWIQKSYINSGAFAICYSDDSKNSAFMFQTGNSTTVILLKTDTGDFLTQFTVPLINSDSLKLAKTTKVGYFLADNSNAFEFAEDGSIYWSAKLIDKKDWNYLYYTNSNYLIFCMKDWVLKSYHTMQTPFAVYKNFWDDTYTNENEELLEDYGKPDTPYDRLTDHKLSEDDRALGIKIFSDDKLDEAIKCLKSGDYGKSELDYLSAVKSELLNYKESLYSKNPNRSYFSQNPIYTEKILLLAALLGNADFTTDFADLLRLEKDPILLNYIVYTSGLHGFDPDGEILNAYEHVLRIPNIKNNIKLQKNVCDATFKICKYMGRPALNKHGKDILSKLYSPAFDKSMRDYSMSYLERFAEIDVKGK